MFIVGYHYNAPHINTKQQKLIQVDSVFRNIATLYYFIVKIIQSPGNHTIFCY